MIDYNYNNNCNMIMLITMNVDYGKKDFALFAFYIREKKYITGAKSKLRKIVFDGILFASKIIF